MEPFLGNQNAPTDEKTFLRLYQQALSGHSLTIQQKHQARKSLATTLAACHRPPLTKQLAKYTDSPEDAEDIVSDAIVRLFKTALGQIGFTSDTNRTNTFVIETSVLSAVKALIGKPFYGKKIGLLFSYYWKKAEQSRYEGGSLEDPAVQGIPSAELPTEVVVQYSPLYSALSNLPSLEYAVIEAKFLSPESDNDICHRLNIRGQEELRSIIRRAKNLLKKEVKAQGIRSFIPSFF